MTLTDNNYYSKKLGEILVDMRIVNDEQVLNALFVSKKTHSKIGSTMVREGMITLEQLKTALKLQLGFDAVTEEQISSLNSNILSILPEDFIKMFCVLPISSDERTLTAGFVNPLDKTVISNVIAYTSMNPKILVITQYEYQMIIQKFF
jgi:MSHA biogenesis protein MshE